MKTNNKGFSLVELIVVIAIMAILAAVAIPTFASFINKANVASDEQFVNDAEYAAELANTIFGEEVSEVKVFLKAGGEIDKVTYKVGTGTDATTVTITNGTTKTVTVSPETATEIKAAADDVVSALDWDYTFKSEKTAGNWERNATTDAWEYKVTQ